MNTRLLRPLLWLLASIVLLQFYFVREILVMGIIFAILFGLGFVLLGTTYLIVHTMLLQLERLLPSHSKVQITWEERSIES
jgi:hypothetical protein